MNKSVLLTAVMILGFSVSLFAGAFEDAGYTLEGKTVEEGNTVYRLRDDSGFRLTAVVKGEPTRKNLQVTDAVAEIFRSMRFVSISSLRIVFTNDRAEIIVLPKAYSYQGQELASYMPSGMQFYYTDYLEYDFRMTAENLFFRVRGQYFSEEQFSERLVAAVKNPFAYIQANDPEYIFRKFLELEKRIDEYAEYGLKAKDELTGGIANLKADVNAEMKENFDALAAKNDGLGREFLLLRYALLVLNNRGFFGSINLPSEKGIERLVQMKRQEPGLSMKEAEARLKADGIEMSSKEVFLVFSVYFNEFK